MHTKDKGDLGEAKVIADTIQRGHKVALPLGENWRYDLVVERQGRLERVQVKYTESDGRVVRCMARSANNWQTIRYTSGDFDWLAVYDKTTDRVYYIPSELLGDGRAQMHLRLQPAANAQAKGIRWAADFLDF